MISTPTLAFLIALASPGATFAQSDTGAPKKRTFIHVVNPFPVDECAEPFCPLDQSQSVALASMIRSKEKTHASVELAAATFPEDNFVVPDGFHVLPPLIRSTASEYPEIFSKKKLPFVQDILDRALRSGIDFEYMIFTNSDIIVHEDFYDIVQNKVDTGLEAFTINRQVIPKKTVTGSLYTKLHLDEIYSLEGGHHPGSDCFVIKRSVLEMLQMGNAYVGFSPWGCSMKYQLALSTPRFEIFRTSDLKATYHLGSDRKWKNVPQQQRRKNWDNVFDTNRLWCICKEKRLTKNGESACKGLRRQFEWKKYDTSKACPQTV